MEVLAYEMKYTREDVEESDIQCIPLEEARFPEYRRMYNACFRPMREALGIEPCDFLREYTQIRDRIGDVFLLVDGGRIIGSVACHGNEIDDLIVHPECQNRGYGRRLLMWGMNHIRKRSKAPISLHVAQWNEKALRIYRKAGFEIARIEKVR